MRLFSPLPPGGKRCNFKEKINIRISPTQNTGIEMLAREIKERNLSQKDEEKKAIRIPIPIPIIIAKNMAADAR
jgi:hypothetical protein